MTSNRVIQQHKAGVIVSLVLFLLANLAAMQGAVAPLTARLGVAGDLSAGTVFTVALGKLEGRSDAEIFQDAVLQSTLSLSMQAGTAAHQAVAAKLGKAEFTTAEAQT